MNRSLTLDYQATQLVVHDFDTDNEVELEIINHDNFHHEIFLNVEQLKQLRDYVDLLINNGL